MLHSIYFIFHFYFTYYNNDTIAGGHDRQVILYNIHQDMKKSKINLCWIEANPNFVIFLK